jgi:hypothetical protein
MRSYYIIFIGLLLSVSSFGQTATALIMPQYTQGVNSSSVARVPFVYRIKFDNLLPSATYRYFGRFVDASSNSTASGEGYFISVSEAGAFTMIPSPAVGSSTARGEFTTDPSGSYTGWFINEAGTSSMFTPGKEIFIRVSLNNGKGGALVDKRFNFDNLKVKVINFGNTATDGTALRSTPAAGTTAKNFVMLYDDAAGTGRPVTATVVESDGVGPTLPPPTGGSAGLAPFYEFDVDGKDKAWGTIIPNNLTNGIQKIVQYGFNGSEVASRVSTNGLWPTTGNTTVSTKSATGGLTNVIVLDGNIVTLAPGTPVKINQQITFNDLPVSTYGDADIDAAAMASSGLTVTYESSDPNVATIVNGHMIHIIGAGTVDITAKQTGDDNYGEAAPVTKKLMVNKADLTITAVDKPWLKGTPMPDLTVTYSGFKNGDDENDLSPQPQITTTATPSSPVGPHDIKVEGAGSPNYNFIYNWGKLTVIDNKLTQTITFTPLDNKNYGDADYNPHATASSKLTVKYISSNTAVATIINDTIIRVVAPGTTTITAKQDGDVAYESAPDVDQQLTVRKAPLQVIAENKSRLVGQDNPALTIAYSGFVKNENTSQLTTQPRISTAADRSSVADDYVIKVEGATAANYDITHVNGILTVKPLPAQLITFRALPVKKYGDANFKLEATATSGLPVSYTSSNPAVATIVGDTAIHITGAGNVIITAVQAGNSLHAPATPVPQTFTVQKIVLNVKADNKSKNQGEANPPFTVSYKGFVNNEDAGALTTLPTVTTTATGISLAGTYTLIAQGAASNNYTIQYQQGVLTILPAQGEGQDNLNAYINAPGQLQVNVYAANDVKTAIQLFDLNGTRLVNTAVSLKQGFNTFRIAIGNVSPGIYNLRVAGNGIMLKTKVVIR